MTNKNDPPDPMSIIPTDSEKSLLLPAEMVNRGLVLASNLELKRNNINYQIPLKQCPGSYSPACISFSKTGKFALITGYGKNTTNPAFIVWNSTDQSRIIALTESKDQNYVYCTALSQNGDYALLGYSDGHVVCWDIKKHVARYFFPTDTKDPNFDDQYIFSFKMAPHQSFTVEQTSAAKNKPISGQSKNSVTSVAFSPNERYFAECVGNYTIRMRDIQSGKEILRVPVGFLNYPNQLAFSHDGIKLAVSMGEPSTLKGGLKSLVTVFDLTGKQGPLVLGGDRIIAATAVAFFPDNQKVLSLESRGVITVWNAQDGKEILHWSHLKSPDDAKDLMYRKEVRGSMYVEQRNPLIWGLSSVAVSPDGKRILSGGGDTFMRLWSLDGHQIYEFPHNTQVVSVAFTSNGQQAISGCWDGSVFLWDLPQ